MAYDYIIYIAIRERASSFSFTFLNLLDSHDS